MGARHDSPHAALANALATITNGKILRSRETSWASASFTGIRHRFVIDLDGDARADVVTGIGEREFDLPGHIVADILLVEREQQDRACRLTTDALTVEDR